jgi:hypothetical protein
MMLKYSDINTHGNFETLIVLRFLSDGGAVSLNLISLVHRAFAEL